MMSFYSYFAYFTMLTTLFLAIRYCIEGFLFRQRLREQFERDDDDIDEAIAHILEFSDSIPIKFYVKHYQKRGQLTLEAQTHLLFAPYLLKLASIKSVAPALGLCFTVISIMISFQVFSESGDIKAMFHAASIGLGTTAIGAISIVTSKLMMDRVMLPCSLEALERFHKQKSLLIETHPLKNRTLTMGGTDE